MSDGPSPAAEPAVQPEQVRVWVSWRDGWHAEIQGAGRQVRADSIMDLRAGVNREVIALLGGQAPRDQEIAWTFELPDGTSVSETQPLRDPDLRMSRETAALVGFHQARIDQARDELRRASRSRVAD